MTAKVVQLPRSATDEIVLVPPGGYRLTYRGHSLASRFKRHCLDLVFVIADFGDHFDKPLVRYYTVAASSKRRSFTAKPHSAFVREYAQIFGKRPNFRAAPIEDFKSCYVIGKVVTVTRDHQQNQLPEAARYSKIGALIRRELG